MKSDIDKPKPKIDIPALAGAKKEDKRIRYMVEQKYLYGLKGTIDEHCLYEHITFSRQPRNSDPGYRGEA